MKPHCNDCFCSRWLMELVVERPSGRRLSKMQSKKLCEILFNLLCFTQSTSCHTSSALADTKSANVRCCFSCTVAADPQCREVLEDFIANCYRILPDLLRTCGYNRARQRDRLATTLEDLATLQEEVCHCCLECNGACSAVRRCP